MPKTTNGNIRLTECCHAKLIPTAEAGGFEPPVRLPVRQFSKLVVSATHPNFQSLRFLADSNRRTRFCRPLTKPLIQGTNLSFFACIVCFSIAVAKVRLFFESASVSMKNFDEIAIFFHLGMFFLVCYIRMDTPHKGCHHALFA